MNRRIDDQSKTMSSTLKSHPISKHFYQSPCKCQVTRPLKWVRHMVNGHVIISEGLQMGGVIVVDLCSVGSVLWPSTCKPIPVLFSPSLVLHLPLVPLSLSPLVPLSLLHFFDLSPSLLPLQYKQPPSLFHSLMMPSQLTFSGKIEKE